MCKWREGYTKVFLKGDSHICLPFDSFNAIEDAWTKGQSFYVGTQLYGGKLTLRLGEVQGILLCTAQSIADEWADDKAEKDRKLVSGED
jgi:hypothetical protein